MGTRTVLKVLALPTGAFQSWELMMMRKFLAMDVPSSKELFQSLALTERRKFLVSDRRSSVGSLTRVPVWVKAFPVE